MQKSIHSRMNSFFFVCTFKSYEYSSCSNPLFLTLLFVFTGNCKNNFIHPTGLVKHGSLAVTNPYTSSRLCLKLRGGHFHPPTDDFNDASCEINGVDITPARDGGVRKKFLFPGHASIALSDGDEVSIYLTGTVKTPDNDTITVLNHSNVPFTFKFGKGQVVSGLEMGVSSMKIGERSLFYVRPEYGYGDDLPWKHVGSNDTLIFEIELLCCGERDLTDGKGGVLFKCLHDAYGFDQPEPIDEVLISLVGSFARDGREFVRTEGPEWADLGSGLLPRGLALGIRQMTIGMKARILLTGSWAFRYVHGQMLHKQTRLTRRNSYRRS